jgi:hypothetical protein
LPFRLGTLFASPYRSIKDGCFATAGDLEEKPPVDATGDDGAEGGLTVAGWSEDGIRNDAGGCTSELRWLMPNNDQESELAHIRQIALLHDLLACPLA